MALTQIVTAAGIVNAEIIKSFLIGCDIEAKYGPSGNVSMLATGGGSMGPNQPYVVYCQEDKVEEALKLLREEGLIDTK